MRKIKVFIMVSAMAISMIATTVVAFAKTGNGW
jgi:hypothetical protein